MLLWSSCCFQLRHRRLFPDIRQFTSSFIEVYAKAGSLHRIHACNVLDDTLNIRYHVISDLEAIGECTIHAQAGVEP